MEADTPTTAYLDQLTSTLGSPVSASASGHILIDTLETFDEQDVDPTEPVPPFHGAAPGGRTNASLRRLACYSAGSAPRC